jgi:hypothetical protein
MTILQLSPSHRTPQPPVIDAGDDAARHALAEVTAPSAADTDRVRACGWFDSSWELQQGLAVSELPEAELPVAALWFAELMPVVLPEIESAWLQ